ncbi:hypothetical protein C1H46_043872 [Malus baccata]|uniref:Uncharacterized protein n=1 Tax=Malus baccata TaxID=106549 RepID=A0A540K8N9_MALBA|nr:hypothetical protein C1H46_043872 [Malus baccata]
MTRGKSCGKGLHNILEANGGKKMPIIFDFKLQVPNDLVVLGFFTTEVENIVQTHSPVCYKKWMKVSPQEKRTLRDKLLLSTGCISITCHVEHLQDDEQSCRTIRYGMGDQRVIGTGYAIMFTLLPTFWYELSNKNYDNKKKQKYHHKGGARPFIQHSRKAHMKGDPLFVIDNWGALHKDKNGKWINDVAQDKYDNMKKKNDELREKLTEEAPEGTPLDSVHVSLDDEFGIMVENLGRKGKSVNGENEQLKARLDLQNVDENMFIKIKVFLAASQGKTNNNFTESNGDILESEDTYPELEEHDLEDD